MQPAIFYTCKITNGSTIFYTFKPALHRFFENVK